MNPVFVLPGALAERADAIAEGLKNSVTLGVGQFCTNPGLTIGIDDERFEQFVRRMEVLIGEAQPGTMLYPAIFESYEAGVRSAERDRRHAHHPVFDWRRALQDGARRARRCSQPARRRSCVIVSWAKSSLVPRQSSSAAAHVTRWKPSRVVSTAS